MSKTPKSSAITAHELQNQLGVVMLHLEIARLQSETLEEAEALQAALKAAAKAAAQMSHLLEAHPMQAAEAEPLSLNKASLNCKPLVLKTWLTEQVTMFMPACKKAGVMLSLKMPDQPLTAVADEVRLTQVLLNLLKNALEALDTPSHKPDTPSISVVLSSEHSKAILTIEDNGLGFSQTQAEHLFEAGITYKAKGSGIGLWLSRQIMDAHGGSLMLHSLGSNRGCIACISLPIFM
jgi:two-component system CheB/CheR fusion protein